MAAPKKVDVKAQFEAAAAAAKKTKKKPDNATLLKLYSYYKQATEGDVSGPAAGGLRLRRRREARCLVQAQGDEQGRGDAELRQAGRQAESRIAAVAHFASRAPHAYFGAFGARFPAFAAGAATLRLLARLAGFAGFAAAPPPAGAFTSLLTAAASSSTRTARRCTSFCV